MTLVGMVFARGGSKGIPNKNLQLVAGKSLIERAIDTALASHKVERIIVSTDSTEIAEVAIAAGAEVPFLRPAHLAEDSSSEWFAWRHALAFLNKSDGILPDAMISIPTTSPLRLVSDIDACIEAYYQGGWDTLITVTEAQRNPYFNMVQIDPGGRASIAVTPPSDIVRRQDSPVLFDICTIAYVVRAEFVLEHDSMWDGRVGTVVIPQERALDIDTPFDLKLAELILNDQAQSDRTN